MATILLFALALLLAVLLSDLAYRSILSTAVLFLVVGFACGSGGLGIIRSTRTLPPFAFSPISRSSAFFSPTECE